MGGAVCTSGSIYDESVFMTSSLIAYWMTTGSCYSFCWLLDFLVFLPLAQCFFSLAGFTTLVFVFVMLAAPMLVASRLRRGT